MIRTKHKEFLVPGLNGITGTEPSSSRDKLLAANVDFQSVPKSFLFLNIIV